VLFGEKSLVHKTSVFQWKMCPLFCIITDTCCWQSWGNDELCE